MDPRTWLRGAATVLFVAGGLACGLSVAGVVVVVSGNVSGADPSVVFWCSAIGFGLMTLSEAIRLGLEAEHEIRVARTILTQIRDLLEERRWDESGAKRILRDDDPIVPES